jgi:hypothetical protein
MHGSGIYWSAPHRPRAWSPKRTFRRASCAVVEKHNQAAVPELVYASPVKSDPEHRRQIDHTTCSKGPGSIQSAHYRGLERMWHTRQKLLRSSSGAHQMSPPGPIETAFTRLVLVQPVQESRSTQAHLCGGSWLWRDPKRHDERPAGL